MWLLYLTLIHTSWLEEVTATPINNGFPASTAIIYDALNKFNTTNTFETVGSCSGDQRTVWGITWSCLATIFACTWIAIHPNVPPDKKWWTTVRRRLILWIYALVAPETIVFWAMRQWYAAGVYAEKYEAQGWTRTHGFFLQMGGFIIYDEYSETKGSPRTVSPPEFNEMVQNKSIVFPTMTEEEIEDRSKGDTLGKGIVGVQTLWFILQCIARKQQNLPITELEVVTLALAALNAVMYGLWLHKPLDVKCPVILVAIPPIPPDVSDVYASPAGHLRNTDTAIPTEPVDDMHPPLTFIGHMTHWLRINCTFANALESIKQTLATLVYLPLYLLVLPLIAMLPLNSMTGNVDNSLSSAYAQFPNTDTPLFYAPKISKKKTMLAFAFVVGAGFGAIHCIAWNFTFVTPVEKLLWRVSSMAITSLPLVYLCIVAYEWASDAGVFTAAIVLELLRILEPLCSCWRSRAPRSTYSPVSKIAKLIVKGLGKIVGIITIIAVVSCMGLYIISRMYMIVEAFLSLRNLPPAALKEVEWTKYIPHI